MKHNGILLLPILLFFGVLSADTYDFKECSPCYSCKDLNVYGDWLYWNIRKCGLDYLWPQDKGECAATGSTEPEDVFNTTNDKTLGSGRPKEIDLCYDHGFRVGFQKVCNQWDFGARYTHYRNCESDSFTPSPDTGLLDCVETPYTPSRMHPDIKGFIDRNNISFAKSRYDMDYDIIEIETGRICRLQGKHTARLFGGVKAAFLDQYLDTDYKGVTSIYQEPEKRIHKVREKVEMNAYGLYSGGEGQWNLCWGLALFGKASVGALLAKFDRSFFEEEINDPTISVHKFSNSVLVDVKDDMHCIVTHLEFAAGIEYLCNTTCVNFLVRVGYELHSWSNMRNFMAFVDHHEKGAIARCTDDLGFDGLFVRLGLLF